MWKYQIEMFEAFWRIAVINTVEDNEGTETFSILIKKTPFLFIYIALRLDSFLSWLMIIFHFSHINSSK